MVIINPTSGGEKALDYKVKLENKARDYFEDVEIKITEKAQDATNFAEEASRERYDAVLVFGGDGSDNPAEIKRCIKEYIKKEYGYDLSKTLDEIHPTYRFNETCQDIVPQAIVAFLESTDFEDAIRNAISLGGDSDTLAAITGSIAEAAYGIPEWIKDKALSYLDEPLKEVLRRWEREVD